MKKIKILTLIGNNYGGSLQAYALYHTLKKYNDDVSIINYTPFSNKENLKDFIKKIVYINRNIKFQHFRDNYMKLTNKTHDLTDDLESLYIVGSDQVWNPNIDFKIRENYYLNFVKDTERKNSYAASIGTEFIDQNPENIKKIKKMLLSFNNITVREQTANKMISDILDKNVETVLDPTLLLTEKEWVKLIKNNTQKEKYICVYTLGLNSKYEKNIDYLSSKKGLKIVDIFYKKRFKNEIKNENGFGPVEFISSIYYSDFVITNSFHGTVFSLLFQKDFLAITRGNMNSRLYDLLKLLGLEDRIVSEEDISTKSDIIMNKKIDYTKVNATLIKERSKSINILKKIINFEESD